MNALKNNTARRLELTTLEDRLVPTVNFLFDYSLDTTGFFNDPAHRAPLERAAASIGGKLNNNLAAITPGGTGNWTANFDNPSTGAQVNLNNLAVPANTMIIYVGGKNTGSSEAGDGGPGGYQVSGTTAFQKTVATRGQTGFAAWGGSLSFDTTKGWYFGADANIPTGKIDFESVATHELVHAIGFGTSQQWDDLVKGNKFTGSHAAASFGSAPALSNDFSHWAQGTKSNGNPVSMQPVATNGQRVGVSELDYAALADLGWQVAGVNSSISLGTDSQAPGTGGALLAAGVSTGKMTVVGGPNGVVMVYVAGADGRLQQAGSFQAFGDYTGTVRAITADVNGDGFADIVVGTGAGGTSRVKVVDGKTFKDMTAEFVAFESSYEGGVFLAAGDFNKDGKDDIVITPDQGGGARVRILETTGGSLHVTADFFGINDPNFRGGARAAVGDLNGDGIPDLVIAAGFGGGPRVSILDGATVLTGNRRTLVADFFAFESTLRNGAYVAIGDANGDGIGDLTFGAGPGGGPRVMTINGNTLLKKGSTDAINNPLSNGFAGDPSQRGGVRVATKDLNGDGTKEVVTGSGTGGEVRTLTNGNTTSTLSAFASDALDGVYVG